MDEVTGPVDRRGPGALRRVRALRVHGGHHRAVLPPVRRHDRRLDGILGHQLADAQPGAGGHPAAAAYGQARPVRPPAGRRGRLVLPLLQLELPDRHQRLHPAGRAVAARQPAGACGLRRPAGAHLQDVRPRAGRLRSPAGPGLADGQRATARLGLRRADQGGAGPDRPDRSQHGGGGAYVGRGRPVAPVDHQQLEFRLDVRRS